MVKANRTAEAQAFILEELERQYGGAAEAAGVGLAGAMDTLGEETRDAMEELGEFVAPFVTKGIEFLTKGIKRLSDFFKKLASTVLPSAEKAFAPILEVMRNIFERIDLEKVANVIGNILVNGTKMFYDALSLITPVLAKIAEGMFFLLENSPFGLMVKGIMKVAEHLGLTQPLVNELEEGAKGAAKGFQDIPPAVDAAVEAQKRKIDSLKTTVGLVEQEKRAVEAQEQAYQNSVKITDSRLNAEKEINALSIQQLEIAYQNTESAKVRLRIASEIFKAELEGARITYQQTLNRIEAEKQALEFRKQSAIIETRIIQAKGELAAAEADSAEKAQLILDKTQNLVKAQRQNVEVINGQIRAQGQIAENQKLAARAVLTQKENQAKVKYEQTLINDELVKGKTEAKNLANKILESSGHSDRLKTSTASVATNALNAAGNFIRVATEADQAANAIARAAQQQRNLNAARAQASSSSSSSSTTTTVQQAAGGYNLGSFKAFARGGVVKGPTLGLIGEGGEPEYIIPQSKAAGFAANFLSGKRGASAIPGFAEGGVAGPINIHTGPVMQQDGRNYVTVEQFTQGMLDLRDYVASSRSYGARRYGGIS